MKTLKEFDNKIGELQRDENSRPFKIINGERVYQIEDDKNDMNDIINRVRGSGFSAWELLKKGYCNR